MKKVLVGTLNGLSSLQTTEGLVSLTGLKATTSLDPASRPILELREHEGQMSVAEGLFSGGVLFETKVLEILPPVASQICRNMLDEGVLSLEDLGNRATSAFSEIAGDEEVRTATENLPQRKTCALVVGHRPGAKGARSKEPAQIWEFDFNNQLAPQVKDRVRMANVEIVFRDDSESGLRTLPRKLNELAPSFIVSLHCNAAESRQANGTEMLYFHKSKASHKMARILQNHVLAALETRNRNTKAKTESERGGFLLSKTAAPCVITEPFFMSNESDMQKALDSTALLAGAYAAAIDEIAVAIV